MDLYTREIRVGHRDAAPVRIVEQASADPDEQLVRLCVESRETDLSRTPGEIVRSRDDPTAGTWLGGDL